jgi:hypothetical protein
MAYTFNGVAKTITLSAGTVTLDLVDCHSRWKDWVFAGNAQYATAFRAVGGDIPAIPLYLFLLNGWRIVPQSANHILTVTNGVLEVDGGGEPFNDPVGTYVVRINRQTPGIAIGYSSNGVTGPSAADIAAAVLALAQVTPIHSDLRKVNGDMIIGHGIPPTYDNTGTMTDPGNPWRPQ